MPDSLPANGSASGKADSTAEDQKGSMGDTDMAESGLEGRERGEGSTGADEQGRAQAKGQGGGSLALNDECLSGFASLV